MRLPSLNALRAFEAAARHESFARAANELCVTEGAVSRHIRLLEEELGVPLFRRLTRRVELTEQGQQLLPVVGSAFADIASGAARVSSSKADLKILACTTFSMRWLLPRLPRFRMLDAGFDAQLSTKLFSWDEFVGGGWDVGFTSGCYGFPSRLKAVPFYPVALTPVCAPHLAASIKSPGDLNRFCPLHSSEDHYDWTVWAKAYGINNLRVNRGQIYPGRAMAAEAAVLGEGVAIAELSLMKDEIAEGKLIVLFPEHVLRSDVESYYFVCPEEAWSDPRVTTFYDWLTEERDAGKIAQSAFTA